MPDGTTNVANEFTGAEVREREGEGGTALISCVAATWRGGGVGCQPNDA